MKARKNILVSLLLSLSILSANELGEIQLSCRIVPTTTGLLTETGTVQITILNSSAKRFPADTLRLSFGSQVNLETTTIPFDSLQPGGSVSMVLPYRRSLDEKYGDTTGVVSASKHHKSVVFRDIHPTRN